MRLRVDFSTNLVSNPYFILQSKPGKSDYQLVFSESSNISKKLRASFIRGRTPTSNYLGSPLGGKNESEGFCSSPARYVQQKGFRET